MENVDETSNVKKSNIKKYVFPISLIVVLFLGLFIGKYIQSYKDKKILSILEKENKLLTSAAESNKQKSVEEPCGSNAGYNLRFTELVRGSCEIRVFYEWDLDYGYSLAYPKEWKTTLRGAAGTNMSLQKGDNELVFVRVAHSDIDFDEYDTVKQGYERSEPSPLVSTRDKVNTKETILINNKKVMKLKTSSEDGNATYYLLDNGLQTNKSIYVIEISDEVSSEDQLKLMRSFTPRYTF